MQLTTATCMAHAQRALADQDRERSPRALRRPPRRRLQRRHGHTAVLDCRPAGSATYTATVFDVPTGTTILTTITPLDSIIPNPNPFGTATVLDRFGESVATCNWDGDLDLGNSYFATGGYARPRNRTRFLS